MRTSTNNAASGFTIIELLVSLTLGLSLVAAILGSIQMYRVLYEKDLARGQVVQRLQGAMTYLGTNVQQAGELLPEGFPVIELINGAGNLPDELIVRKNLLDEVPFLCQTVSAGSTTFRIAKQNWSVNNHFPACAKSNVTDIFNTWEDYRDGGTVDAYIFNSQSKEGEFFQYSNSSTTSAQYRIISAAGLSNASGYPHSASNLYILRELHFSVLNNTLVLTTNGAATSDNIVSGLTDMQISIELSDGTTVDAFGVNDNWKEIALVTIELTGTASVTKQEFEATLSGSFFPRNVMSK